MGGRLWIVAIVLAGLFLWGVGYVLTPENGDAEFQKMMEATEQVKSFRGAYVAGDPSPVKNLWEVDCNRNIVHKQSQGSKTGAASAEMADDLFLVGTDQKYTLDGDGSWQPSKYTA